MASHNMTNPLANDRSHEAIPQKGQSQSLESFVWFIAEILRGDFKQSEYGKVILPFVVMRRLDCILEASKDAVLKAAKGIDEATKDMVLFGCGRQQSQGLQSQRPSLSKA